jgi:hypothetical protein
MPMYHPPMTHFSLHHVSLYPHSLRRKKAAKVLEELKLAITNISGSINDKFFQAIGSSFLIAQALICLAKLFAREEQIGTYARPSHAHYLSNFLVVKTSLVKK